MQMFLHLYESQTAKVLAACRSRKRGSKSLYCSLRLSLLRRGLFAPPRTKFFFNIFFWKIDGSLAREADRRERVSARILAERLLRATLARPKPLYKPCTRSRQQVCPLIRVEKFSSEHRCKIGIRETRAIVIFHEFDALWLILSFPMPPKPFRATCTETRNRIHPPVHENSELRIVVPGWKRPRIKRLPRRLIFRLNVKQL